MNYTTEKPSQLLNVDKNAKTVKGQSRGYLTGILYLFPHKSHGFNICPAADIAGCSEVCLQTSGRLAMNGVARLRKTYLFHYEREWFMWQLYRDIEALVRKAEREGLTPVVRLNGLSDLDWESLHHRGRSLMEWFPLVQFYDYTKLPRLSRNRNYHLTFSYSPKPEFAKIVRKADKLGMNMAVVFSGTIPKTFLGRKVIDGDENDLRFLDPPNCVIGLKAKGVAKKIENEFVVQPHIIARATA